ncbi:hypothetical protein MnTg04_01482 [bacterium MnTg04]|nr:hypothetical protein MnTg04_01482 [bacterium MnTg04]
MGSATQLGGKIAHAHDPHPVAVFLAKQGHGAGADRIVIAHGPALRLSVFPDFEVDPALDLHQLLRTERLKVREIEAQPVGCDQRAFLGYMVAEQSSQCGMQQVGGRVIQDYVIAPPGIDRGRKLIAFVDAAFDDRAVMHDSIARFSAILDSKLDAFCAQHTRVTDLTTAFAIERRAVHHDLA